MSVSRDAGPPIIGAPAIMHHGDDNDFVRIGAVDERIGKTLETAPANVLPDLWPQFREVAKPPGRCYHLFEEIVAQAGYFRIVVLDGFVEFMLRRRDKPRFHRFFRAAIISSSVTEAISPRS